jgi:hypothetical protein
MIAAVALERQIEELDGIFSAALAAAVANPAALVFTDLPLDFNGKRDLLFAIGLLNEGENEAALIAGLAQAALRRTPGFDIAHLEREAWYYLRTSIDPAWQFDDGAASIPGALAYLAAVLRERIALLAAQPSAAFVDPAPSQARAALLRKLRDVC